jgi:hypothetical protein
MTSRGARIAYLEKQKIMRDFRATDCQRGSGLQASL